jgi:phosphatidylserine/phosphatidylglycerophosphate/cardiolipin synthase-like enzyme
VTVRSVRWVRLIGTLVAAATGLTACSGSGSGSGSTTATTATTAVPGTTTVSQPSTTTTATPAFPNLTLEIEPADQFSSIYQMIQAAQHSLDMTMYELADPEIVTLLADAERRGVAVRVLLDRAGSGAAVNQDAFTQLASQGVPVRWAPEGVLFHQKTLTADGSVSAIMTGNLTANYYPTARDFVVFDRSPVAVSSIEAVFTHDWDGGATARVASLGGLVWSPGSRSTLVGLINSAHTSLAVENEEMRAPSIVAALRAARQRGVVVTVTMTYNPSWVPAWTALARAGVEVSTYPDTASAPYIHAKVIVVDALTAFVGSQNFSNDSLVHNRELGLTTSDAAVVGPLSETLAADFAGATPFRVTPAPGTGTTRTTTHTGVATTTTRTTTRVATTTTTSTVSPTTTRAA